MRKRIIVYSVLMLILYLFDTVFPPFRLMDITPEIVFVGIICLSMLEDERFGAVFGLVFGLLCDFSASGVFGLKALFFMAVGYMTGFLTEKFLSVNLPSALFLAAVHTAVVQALICLLYSFFMGENFAGSLFYIALPKIALSVPCAVIIYFIFRAARHFITRREEREGTW